MERKVNVGYWYIVGGPVGATVTVPGEVNPCCTVPEGGQGSFYAQAPVVIVSDESVMLSQVVNFKGAPVKRWLLGLGRGVNTLPSGYLAAEFMQNSELGWVDTGVKAHGDTAVECEFIPTQYYWVNFYYASGHQNKKPVMLGSFDYNKEYGRRFTYGYGNNNKVRLDGYEGRPGYYSTLGKKYITKQISGAFYINGEFVYEIAYEEFESLSNICFFGSLENGNVGVKGLQMYYAKVSRAGVKQRDFVPAIDTFGVPCLFDRVSKEPFYFKAYTTGAVLIAGMTLAQARKLGELPAGGGTLTVSLPWDAQLDKKVDAALSEAKAKDWTIVVQYQEPDTNSAVYNKYAACKTLDDVLAVNDDYLNDLTADGEWIYPMPEITRFPNMHNSWWYGFFKGSKIKKIKATFPKCTYSQAMLGSVSTVEEVDLEFPVATHVSTTCENCDALRKVRIIAPKATRFDYNVRTHKANKLVECELYAPEATNIEYLVTGAGTLEEVRGEFGAKATNLNNAFANCPMLKVFPTNYPKASTASGMFSNCQLPKEAAIAVLNSLSSYTSGTHSITMGIHKNYESDADVLSAIENAEAKGWTVTVQWNGTATAQTASTWGLRRKLVYAKVVEIDGTQYLDWGHYVTNWEANGYQEFASVDEAKEYFNIED